jgi:hypothetical protein
MLDRIAALLENLRQVSSDVAHDLRTPLTHLRGRLEQAHVASATVEDYSAAVARAIADTDEVLRVTALLRISQISYTRAAAFSVLRCPILNRIYEMYRPVAEDHGHAATNIRDAVNVRVTRSCSRSCSSTWWKTLRHTPTGTSMSSHRTSADAAIARVRQRPRDRRRARRSYRFYRVTTSHHARQWSRLALVAAIAKLHQAIELPTTRPACAFRSPLAKNFAPGRRLGGRTNPRDRLAWQRDFAPSCSALR